MAAKSQNHLIDDLRAEGIVGAPRERAPWMAWLADGSGRFLSVHDGRVELWLSRRPYAVNERLDSLPLEQATTETVAAMVTA